MRQLVLALVLIGHSPYRGRRSSCSATSSTTKISLGTVHNIVHSAVEPARAINRRYDLAGVRIGAHDEIFQAGQPVLVGVDTASTICYLLSLEDHRDADTWGVRLLELVDQGFAPEATVADAGTGLRAGQALALPEVPCRGDVFHLLRDLEQVVTYLENRAYEALDRANGFSSATRAQRHGRAGPRTPWGHGCGTPAPPATRPWRCPTMSALLMGWLRHDILAVAGPCYADRRALYDFVVAELQSRVASVSPSAGADLPAVGEPAGTTCWPSPACSTRSWR